MFEDYFLYKKFFHILSFSGRKNLKWLGTKFCGFLLKPAGERDVGRLSNYWKLVGMHYERAVVANELNLLQSL